MARWECISTLPVRRSINQTLSSVGLSMPTNRVPTAVTSVDSKIAAAMMAEPINTEPEVPKFPDATGRCP